MAEIKREPIKIIVGDVEYTAFDEGHTISDAARWLHTQGDTEAAILVLQEALAEVA
jgi:hypothetical protein